MSDHEEDAMNGADWSAEADDWNEPDSDFECPDCNEQLDEKSLCVTETCDNFECNPFDGGGAHFDEAKWERQQMGICG